MENPGWIKLNIDGAFEKLKSGIGGIFRDNTGKWILGFQKFCHSLFPLHTELQALYEGLQMAHKFNLFSLEIETDSTDVINAINNGHTSLSNLIHPCRLLMHQEKGLLVRHNFREGNAIADSLAKEAKNQEKKYMPEKTKLFTAPPFCVQHMLSMDRSGESKHSKQLSISVCNILTTLGNQNIASDAILHTGLSNDNVTLSDTMLCNDAY
ncbi:PREDICTED: uncharacterized protein LOC109237239 [Nicotiana attenuata]|uniref:uncharacterized protein LOC109237239 n=1 Tax=Nicotiana attenuata TaxID=49451 RepID=UPI0009053A33|nr:PREDICTED: uncharacterized protein LOC109237239 [Nicotiana attenuata]